MDREIVSSPKPFDCSTPFLARIKKDHTPVELFLLSGIRLTGIIDAFDERSIVFYGGVKDAADEKQLIMRNAIASIIPK